MLKNLRSILHKSVLIYLILAIFIIQGCDSKSTAPAWNRVVPEILQQIVPPTFPDKDYNIIEYGAVGDGKTLNTEAFENAIDACHNAGGGRVVVPAGEFLTGAIHMKSNVNLHVEESAVILFSRDLKDYLPVVYTRFEGVEFMNYSPFIYAFEQENLAITGKGTLDGQADNTVWWPWVGKEHYGWKEGDPIQTTDRDNLFQMGEDNVPVEERIFGDGHYMRVNFIQPYRCKNILIEDVTLKRSPMWEVHPVLCENITVRNITVISHGPNNDGCNPESSKNVLIENCYFDTGDDCIAIKSGRNNDGRRVNVPSENIVIRNCKMKDGHGGVVIGSECSGNVRNVFAENCEMDSPNLDRALRIKTNSIRGGVIENIFMRDVQVGEVREAVVKINYFYAKGEKGDFIPVVRNVHVENVTSEKSKYGLLMRGFENSPIQNVSIVNCSFNGVDKGNLLENVTDLKLKKLYINGELVK